MSHAELCADTEIALERYLALSCIVRPPTVVERIVVCDPTNESAPVPQLGSRSVFGRPKLDGEALLDRADLQV